MEKEISCPLCGKRFKIDSADMWVHCPECGIEIQTGAPYKEYENDD